MKQKIFILFMALHFSMLGLGMLGIALAPGWPRKFQLYYARATGAGGSFGFFSPNVPREIVVNFVVEGIDGRRSTFTLQENASSEVRVRLGNMIRLLAQTYDKKEVARSVAASLTAVMYRRHPEAKSVTLNMELHQFPSMLEFQSGQRPSQVPIYSAQFTRADE